MAVIVDKINWLNITDVSEPSISTYDPEFGDINGPWNVGNF
jgi:hypothetical protein